MRSQKFLITLAPQLSMWFVLALFSGKAVAEKIPFETASDPEIVRAKLVPAIEQTLSKICGADCTGFSVRPNIKNGTLETTSIDDLGFEEPAKKPSPEDPKEATSVTVEVLINKNLDPAIQETIKSTLAAVARNHTDLPVSVRAKPVTLPAVSVSGESALTKRDWMDFVKTGLWPIAILCLALLALVGLFYTFRARRKMAVTLHELQKTQKSEAQDINAEIINEKGPDLDMFSDRFDDLRFFMEQSAERNDLASLKKIVSLFPGNALSKKLGLSPIVPAVISKAILEDDVFSANGENDAQKVQWLKACLDKIHWKRLEESSDPIAKISRLSDSHLSSLFTQVGSEDAKALVLSGVNSEKWPALLSTLSAPQKVTVGCRLSKIQQSGGETSSGTRSEILDSLSKVAKTSRLEHLLDEYVLYLSEEETTSLANQLSSVSGLVARRKSVDNVILGLDTKELLELVLRLDVDQIRTLLEHLPTEPQQKILSALPKKLKERVGFFASGNDGSESDQDPKWLQTRSRLFKLYQESYSRNGARSIH